jgi:alcohol dehydrogenase
MKAAQITGYGGKEVFEITENAEKPVIGEGQVLVEVSAAGVNPFDNTVLAGNARGMAELEFPAVLGGDFAGTVAELSEGVVGFEVGQKVYGQASPLSGHGSFAEFTPVKASQLAGLPINLDFVSAAALPLTSASAYQALVEHIGLQPDQRILIHGGAGGIGSMAIQIARNIGAYIATTARTDEADYVKGLGADEVIDYQTQDFSEILKDYDAVYDTVGGETTAKSYTILKPGGALVSMLSQPDEELVEKYEIKFTAQFTRVTTEKLSKIAELVTAGKLHVNVDKVFPLNQAGEALEYLKTGHPRGKVVIQVKS